MSARRWVVALVFGICVGLPAGAGAQVLRVGTWHKIVGQFATVTAAVKAAKPGDKILVAPGDYKTNPSQITAPSGQSQLPSGVLITTPNLLLRGMNRAGTVIDGTKPGSPQCSSNAADQNFGPAGSGGDGPQGSNGIMIYKAANVSVENLTACNFLGGSGDAGNEIWWNGGANTGTVGGWGFYGSYLSATSTFYRDETSAAQYGIFSSNWSGGTWDQIYASNFNDSGFYIGACQQICNQTLNHGWSEYNALGYSGTNSGGYLVVKNSQFDNNQDGFDTNSQDADEPAPQNGACPNNGISPITHTHSCWVFMHNYVHDNNNPNVPASGSAANGPVGTGMSVAGARNDTIMNNTFANNNAWGFILVPYPDSTNQPCDGGVQTQAICLYDEYGDAVLNNTFTHNGSYGNNTNGDIGFVNTQAGPTNCFSGNKDTTGPLTTSPSNVQSMYPTCDGHSVPPNTNPLFLQQVACDSEAISFAVLTGGQTCLPAGENYPRHDPGQPMHALPALPSMPHPCSGVSTDPWCSGQVIHVPRCAAARPRVTLNLAVRERFTSYSVRIGKGRTVTHKAKGRRVRVRVNLRRLRHRYVRVRYTEHLRVGKHREHAFFIRIYHRC